MTILGLTLSACGGESVEDRARALKAARQPAAAPTDPNAPLMAPTAPIPTPTPAPMSAPASSSATPAPLPPP
ncbi:MAG TPA: hypothetical protein VLT33_36700 [Labilithrix sp.]|nr:hypothetical protein [Labilithrix sp.]